jgi:RNA polymerase sigma-70 factor (ECF subfamily)
VRSDEELMAAYVGGDLAAFDELFQRYAPQLLPLLARGLGRADAADLLQQTFLQLHRSRSDFRRGEALRPWLFTIAVNVKRQHLRSLRRRRECAGLDLETLASPEPPAIREETTGRIDALLAELPQEQSVVIRLHFMEGLSFQRIAEVVGASVGAVRVRAHRGYVSLRRRFTGRGDDE